MQEMVERIKRKRNAENIEITTTNNLVDGNYIGTDATDTLNGGNRSDDGAEIRPVRLAI
jgi:hypothetical protein